MKRVLYILLLIVLLGALVWSNLPAKKTSGEGGVLSGQEKKYPYLSKRILQDYPADLLINFQQLRRELRSMTAPYADTFGFYFEYLPTGTSIGVNEKNEFTAASLLKVPIVMAYYHQKERLGVDDDPLVTLTEEDINKNYGELWKRGVGAKILLSEAVKIAITDSDNTAASVVSRYTSAQDYKAISEGLDIELHEQKETPIISLKHYSSILKALFFASLISKEHSQLILGHLSETKFKDKLPAGVEKNIKVANKIGILEDKLYTDCGIIYLPRRPYLLCMVSASGEEEARLRMRSVSKKVFEFLKDASVSK